MCSPVAQCRLILATDQQLSGRTLPPPPFCDGLCLSQLGWFLEEGTRDCVRGSSASSQLKLEERDWLVTLQLMLVHCTEPTMLSSFILVSDSCISDASWTLGPLRSIIECSIIQSPTAIRKYRVSGQPDLKIGNSRVADLHLCNEW